MISGSIISSKRRSGVGGVVGGGGSGNSSSSDVNLNPDAELAGLLGESGGPALVSSGSTSMPSSQIGANVTKRTNAAASSNALGSPPPLPASTASTSSSSSLNAKRPGNGNNTMSITPATGRVHCGNAGTVQVPRWLAILLSMCLVMALFVGLVVLVMDAMQTFEQDSLSAYEERTVELANIALRWLKRSFNVDGSYMLAQIKGEFQLVQMTKSLLLVLMNAVAYTFIVLLFVLYMLFENVVNENNGAGGGATDPSSEAMHRVRRQIDNQIQRYLVTKTAISAVVGLLTFLVLGPLLHVKMAHLFGVVTFLMNFIPNVGAVIATLLPIPIVMLDPNLSMVSVVLAFALPTMIHTVVGNIVEPVFFGSQMELHPIVVLLSLSFWFSLWGVAGAILSVPITAVIRIVVSNIRHPYAAFVKNLLEGKIR